MSENVQRADCPVCGRAFAIRGDGTIRTHDHLQERCTGSRAIVRDSRDASSYFGLTYSNFLVLHRVELEHMPEAWQHRFVAMLDELEDAYDHLEHPEGYEVYPCRWVLVEELNEQEAASLGVTDSLDDFPALGDAATAEEFTAHDAAWEEASENRVFHDANGNELDPQSRDPIRVPDPMPHYRHGHVEPNLEAIHQQAAKNPAPEREPGGVSTQRTPGGTT